MAIPKFVAHFGRITLVAFAASTLSMSCSSTRAAQEIPVSKSSLKDGNWDALKMSWDRPEADNASLNGTPIGNGHIGAKIKGGVATEIMPLNDKWFWSGGPDKMPPDPKRRAAMEETRKVLAAGDIPAAENTAKGMWGTNEIATFLPLGTLSVAFDHGDAATDYSRVLDIDRATSIVKYTIGDVTYTREAFATHPDDVIVLKISGSKPGKINFTAKLDFPPEMLGHGASVATDGSDAIIMKLKAPANDGWDDKKGMTAECRMKIIPQSGTVSAKDGALVVAGADSATFIIANATSYNGFDKEPGTQGVDPTPLVKKTIAAATTKSYEQLVAAHLKDYHALFRRVSAEINGEQPNAQVLGFQYARFNMIVTSRHGNRPHNQQGMWNSRWKPSSQSAHWLNENVQKYYSLIETANLPECGESLWNWMDELAANGKKSAEIDWGFKGWLAAQCSDIWATTTLTSGNNEWAIWPMGGIWLCENLYDHYAFSGDKKFLRDRAYPLMKGACEFALDYMVQHKDGYLVTSPSTSAENRFGLTPGGTAYAVTVGATQDTALIKELFEQTIEASKTLNIDADFRAKLVATIPKMAPYRIGANGELQEWDADYSREPADPRKRFTPHRHASHILTVWPLSQITKRDTALFAATKLALENRARGGYHPDKGAMWARLHEGDKALASGDSMQIGNRVVGQTPPKYSAFPELFVQSHTDAIDLLPALPTAWKTGKIAGLRARGGYEVALEWKDGELTSCQIDSTLGTTPVVRYKDQVIDLSKDKRIKINK
ncbi:MAG: glycoside hydrolase family 95 protein [Burkholderiales bacterium]|nr:glycoside hydrolase family 95 protein [Phycisphaerae bacterium]